MLVLVLVAAAIFITIPLIAYFRSPVYSWEMTAQAFTQGGLEALLLFAAFAAISLLRVKRNLHIVLLCFGIAIYLRLYAVELPFIFGVVWLEGILATGAVLFGARDRLSAGTLFSLRFALGICVWTVGALLLSLLHLASPAYLLLYGLLLFAVALLMLRRKPFIFTAFKYLTHGDQLVAISSGYILLSVLVLFARNPTVVDFDSIWYGLRSIWVLAPHGSIFDRLNLISLVYYYPKLFEQLTLPTSFFADFSFIYAINICVYLASGICALALVRQLGAKFRYAMLAAALVVSMPAMTTMTMTAKPDLLVSYFLLLGSLCFALAIKRAQPVWMFGTFSSVLLGLSTKLTAIPFGGLLSVAALLGLVFQCRIYGVRRILGRTASRGPIALLLAISAIIFITFCWRTYHLAGYPVIGDPLVTRIFDVLGFAPIYPVNVSHFYTVGSVSNHFTVLYDYLFDPTVLLGVNFVWPGNVGAFLFILGCLWVVISKPRLSYAGIVAGLSPMVIAGCLLAISYGADAGGDGNYYIFPVTLAALLGLSLLWQSGGRARFATLCMVPAFVAANSYLGFLLSPGAQHPGTMPFSLNFTRPPISARERREEELKAQGLGPIEQFMTESMGGDCRGVAAGSWRAIYMLPCTLENFGEHQKGAIFESQGAFIAYLNFARINLLISPKFPADATIFKTADRLRGMGLQTIETPTYFAVDLRALMGRIPLPANDEQTPVATHVNLMNVAPVGSAIDLRTGDKPRQGLYGTVPGNYGFFTEQSPALFVNSDVAVLLPIGKIGLPASWTFSASVGFRPEDAVARMGPVDFEVRVTGRDGREFAAKSWRLSFDDYRSVSFEFHGSTNNPPMYIELRCIRATIGGFDQPQIFIGRPEILYH